MIAKTIYSMRNAMNITLKSTAAATTEIADAAPVAEKAAKVERNLTNMNTAPSPAETYAG